MKISKRAQKIKSFIAMDILEKVQEFRQKGEDVISLALGEPDFPPPPVVKEACIKALSDDFTKYTHSQGMIELRQAIVTHYKKRYQVEIKAEQVFVTAGTSPAFFLILSALLNPKDEVILPNLHYPCYSNFIEFLGGKISYVKVHEKDRFQYPISEVRKKITKKTKGIFISSPANPSGYLVPDRLFEELASLSPYLISDEIYHGLVYEGKERSALEFTDRAFVVNGFSKAYSMTGFRLGYVIVPFEFIEPIRKIEQNFYISVNSFVQKAGIAALEKASSEQEEMRQQFIKRRDVALEELDKIGLRPKIAPEGAFYLLVDIHKYSKDSYHLAFDCLDKVKVGITPGIDFGKGGEGYIRISYANSIENIREGIQRLGRYLKLLKKTV